MHRKFVIVYFAVTFFTIPLCGQITRGDTTQKNIALVFTGDEYGDGGSFIAKTLQEQNVKAAFFLTGNFYRNNSFQKLIKQLVNDGHYLGSHSDKHLLYCDWSNRDSLLVSREEFSSDLENSYHEMNRFGITKQKSPYFLPPYEWYNDSIVKWTNAAGLTLINFSPGTRSTADYTYPDMGTKYVGSDEIYNSILQFESRSPSGLNGFILLVHIGTDPRRKDKFYKHLPKLIAEMKKKGYKWMRVDELLQ